MEVFLKIVKHEVNEALKNASRISTSLKCLKLISISFNVMSSVWIFTTNTATIALAQSKYWKSARVNWLNEKISPRSAFNKKKKTSDESFYFSNKSRQHVKAFKHLASALHPCDDVALRECKTFFSKRRLLKTDAISRIDFLLNLIDNDECGFNLINCFVLWAFEAESDGNRNI